MTYGNVKIKHGRGILKEYWDHIVPIAALCSKESETAKDVLKLHNSLIKYARYEPWPFPSIDCYSSDYFAMKFFTQGYTDFSFYLGAGMALEGLVETVRDDIEAEITKARLTNLEEHDEKKRIFLIESKNTVVDYLLSHISEIPTQKEIAKQTGIGLTRLRVTLVELKSADLLVMKSRAIVSIDVDMVEEDIEVQVS